MSWNCADNKLYFQLVLIVSGVAKQPQRLLRVLTFTDRARDCVGLTGFSRRIKNRSKEIDQRSVGGVAP